MTGHPSGRSRPAATVESAVASWPPRALELYEAIERTLFGLPGLRANGSGAEVVLSLRSKALAWIASNGDRLVVRTTSPKPFRTAALEIEGLPNGIRDALKLSGSSGAEMPVGTPADVDAVGRVLRAKVAYLER